MSKFEFMILSILLSNNAINSMSAMTAKDICTAENLGYERNTYYKRLKAFHDQGLVGIGAQERRSMTFYITKLGIQKLKEVKEDEE